ncbi:PREDICTED: spindle and kinetochore-associated protein 2 isoform X1 [Gekko japonicus]|uniref:Protein FAM33A n=2 Tax=Gekko japonicus TaxID=146911 RepID=A0ABM1L116_GEKJA|nr:PREDICTED: spindle and kinetochore-associated protein 2 isoform X1 [Gekko japonicus]
MEAAVNTLEAMFQVAESDLDSIQSMLEFETMKGIPGELSQEENPLALIQQLSVMKSRYKMLCDRLDRISAEQQESMRSINATLNKTLMLVQKIQQHAGIETLPLSEEQQLAIQQIRCHALQKTDAPGKQNCPKEHQIH